MGGARLQPWRTPNRKPCRRPIRGTARPAGCEAWTGRRQSERRRRFRGATHYSTPPRATDKCGSWPFSAAKARPSTSNVRHPTSGVGPLAITAEKPGQKALVRLESQARFTSPISNHNKIDRRHRNPTAKARPSTSNVRHPTSGVGPLAITAEKPGQKALVRLESQARFTSPISNHNKIDRRHRNPKDRQATQQSTTPESTGRTETTPEVRVPPA